MDRRELIAAVTGTSLLLACRDNAELERASTTQAPPARLMEVSATRATT